jgi:hypothetical protein
MKVLDYEQVNGEQDKGKEAEEQNGTSHHRFRRHRAGATHRRPRPFTNGQSVSYMHGSHIGERYGWRQERMSTDTAVPPPEQEVNDLSVPQTEKGTPEEMV